MATRKLISKNIIANSTQYIGKDGEMWVDTDTNKLKISDGATAGGVDLVGVGGGGGGGATTWAGITDIDNGSGPFKIAIGRDAGSAGNLTVAIGYEAGKTSQGANAIAIGANSGEATQGGDAVAVGVSAGETTQGNHAVAVGYYAGNTTQGAESVAIGKSAGETTQANYAQAIGNSAGNSGQGQGAVALGSEAGKTTQGARAVAIGNYAGLTTQGSNSIAMGWEAGKTNQGNTATALGNSAGVTNQGENATAIGAGAGVTDQGTDALAIGSGAGTTNQAANSIVINATNGVLENTTADSLVVKPVRNASGTHALEYNPTTGEVTYDTLGGGGGSLQSRIIRTNQTTSLADGAEADLDITGFKAYTLMAITTDRAARVRLYVTAATRTADAARAEGVDPTSDAGLIAEVITTGAETVIISPGAYGFNLESSTTTNIPCRVTNKSGGTSTVQVDLLILQLEA